MIVAKLESITATDLQSLIDTGVKEGKTIEFKRDLPGDSSDERKKLLRAICSLANTAGGDLIYGVEAVDGVPVALPGLDGSDEDGIRLRIENSCRDGIQPRIPGLTMRLVTLAGNCAVLVIRVRSSWAAPHRLGSDGHFYARNSAGGYQLDVGELRQAFTLADGIVERIREFRIARLMKIEGNDGPVDLEPGVKAVFHMIPWSAFSGPTNPRIEPSDVHRRAFSVMGTSATRSDLNLDGFLQHSPGSNGTSKVYTQLFRNGSIETVSVFSNIQSTERPVPSAFIENQLVRLVGEFTRQLKMLDVGAPYIFFLSFLGIKNSHLLAGRSYFGEVAPIVQRGTDSLLLPEVMVEAEQFDPAEVLRPLFDSYWNAYGYERSSSYDDMGKWRK